MHHVRGRDLVRKARLSTDSPKSRLSRWNTGDSLATAYGGIVPMPEYRNVTRLATFIEELA
ncbi:hypothetical protein [Streptosporangium roseum]|uniref:hypothetical protein n=1 Tax=Streptosporangium roseum TaxID=2001 RepID=UPI003328422E